ncbi:hypothetical protein D027_3783A, partial [Vibrio parahaemolyticus 861]
MSALRAELRYWRESNP